MSKNLVMVSSGSSSIKSWSLKRKMERNCRQSLKRNLRKKKPRADSPSMLKQRLTTIESAE